MRPRRRIRAVEDHRRIRWVLCFGLLIFAACFAMMLWTSRATAATASWYGPGFAGRLTANQERFDPEASTCAHRTLKFGTVLRLRHAGRVAYCRVNDRGPFIAGRELDLSPAVFARLADPDVGLIRVRMERVP